MQGHRWQDKVSNKHFVGATQNAVVRLDDLTSKDVLGLYTDGLKVCLGIVLYGKNGHVSLMHYDGTVGVEEMKAEFAKIPDLQKIELWRNSSEKFDSQSADHRDKFLDFLKRNDIKLKPTLRLTKNGSFYVERDGYSHTDKPKASIKLIKNHVFRHSVNMLNHLFGDESIDEQYNGRSWSSVEPKLKENVSLESPDAIFELAKAQCKLDKLTEAQQATITQHWESKVLDYKRSSIATVKQKEAISF